MVFSVVTLSHLCVFWQLSEWSISWGFLLEIKKVYWGCVFAWITPVRGRGEWAREVCASYRNPFRYKPTWHINIGSPFPRMPSEGSSKFWFWHWWFWYKLKGVSGRKPLSSGVLLLIAVCSALWQAAQTSDSHAHLWIGLSLCKPFSWQSQLS